MKIFYITFTFILILLTIFKQQTIIKLQVLNKNNQEQITDLKYQIENMRSIQRWQESIIRDCGFYGEEP